MIGFVNIFKPLNMTSSDVVVKVRGILKKASGEKQKTGHLGTLDPLATGVLPIAIGNATRLFDYTLSKTKTYIATFKFGETTDTLDSDGKITDTFNKTISKQDVLAVIPKLVGDIDQIPPQYSAKSVGGKKAYDIARAGGSVSLAPKRVHIDSIRLIENGEDIKKISDKIPRTTDYKYDGRYSDILNSLSDNEFAFEIVCGGGTYIRSIARDMAEALGTVGYMSSLCRTQSGDFDLSGAVTLEQFEQSPLECILPLDIALKGYDVANLDEKDGEKALNGVKIEYNKQINQPFVVKICDKTVGIGELKDCRLFIKTRL